MSSPKQEILDAIKARVVSVTAANGYTTNILAVYADKIPMGLDLNSYELPAVFILDGPDTLEFEHACVKGNWDIRMQLWHNEVDDSVMMQFVRDIFKALYADSPTAQVNDKFRSLHPSLVELIPATISPDLHLIDANRVCELTFIVRYRTKLFNM